MNPEMKHVINVTYHSAITVGLTLGYSQLLKRFIRTVDTKTMDPMDFVKLTTNVALANMTREYLIKMKFLPDDIVK